MNIIEIKDLYFSYEDEEEVLKNINMSIKKGKTTGILGGNGAGKSTLFLTLNGILKPNSGKVIIKGKDIDYSKKGLLNIRKNIGIVFQDPENQLFSASVIKDISFGVKNLGLSEEEIKKRVEFVIEKTGIKNIVNRPTHSLSFGQKKRVAIAGILAMDPSIIILDEPTAGLDPKGVNEILNLLEDIKKTMGITIIISTHEMDLVPIYCDEVFVLDNGKVVFQGTPKKLFDNPQILVEHNLRLPRITYLMNILHNKDKLDVNPSASTVSQARESINSLFSLMNKKTQRKMNKYIIKNGKKLRIGYTTGTCAAAASKAAAIMLLEKKMINKVDIKLPNNEKLCLEVEDIIIDGNSVSCSIVKDAGDDPDVTDGIKIHSKVKLIEEGIELNGGVGIGKVTKKGLSCKIGDSAINPVPRKMIKEALMDVAKSYEYKGGFNVEIFVPKGEEIAKKTFNQRLGIEGGISILGTTGIVEPMSEAALIDTIKLEINNKIKNNYEILLLSPGNYGLEFLKEKFNLDINLAIKCSNYIGETIDYALYKGVKKILIIGHIGKLVKIAAGVMNTHSKIADSRQEIFAAHSALFGANSNVIKKIMDSVTTDEIHNILKENKLEKKVYDSILKKIVYNINYRLGGKIDVEFIIFSNSNGVLMKTEKAEDFVNKLRSD